MGKEHFCWLPQWWCIGGCQFTRKSHTFPWNHLIQISPTYFRNISHSRSHMKIVSKKTNVSVYNLQALTSTTNWWWFIFCCNTSSTPKAKNHHSFKCLNTLRPRHNGRHFADSIFKCIFFNENVLIAIKISLKFVPKGPIKNVPALVQIII